MISSGPQNPEMVTKKSWVKCLKFFSKHKSANKIMKNYLAKI